METILKAIEEFKPLNIKVELIGSWLWITGETYPIREKLKALGFLFSGSKKAWFYNGSDKKIRYSKYKSVDEIKQRFGCVEVTGGV